MEMTEHFPPDSAAQYMSESKRSNLIRGTGNHVVADHTMLKATQKTQLSNGILRIRDHIQLTKLLHQNPMARRAKQYDGKNHARHHRHHA